MPQLDNSDVLKQVLQTVIAISRRKTSEGHAVSTLNTSLKNLESQYQFLKHIEVRDVQYLEEGNPVSVMTDVNAVPRMEVGKALVEIITTMTNSLGKNAGYFFIKELKNNLQDTYSTSFEDMGLDLGLMQLENEIRELGKKIQK